MISYILSLLSLTNAVIVTETEFAYATVTVYAPMPTDGVAPEGNKVETASLSFNSTSGNSTNTTNTTNTTESTNSTNLTSSILSSVEISSDILTPLPATSAETSPDTPQYSEIVVTSTLESPAPVETSSPAPAAAEVPPVSVSVQQDVNANTVQNAAETSTAIAGVYTEAQSSPEPQPEPTTVVTTEPQAEPTTSEAAAAEPSTAEDNSSSQQLDSFAQDIVDFHNKVRADHKVGAVTWNQDLANFAQNYLAGSNCNFAHSGGPYGENIAMGYDQNDQAMQAWYDEYKQYDYAAGQFSSSTGHFTQMVWKGTTEIGCATINCPGWGPYLACEYTPRGNIIGDFTNNVFA